MTNRIISIILAIALIATMTVGCYATPGLDFKNKDMEIYTTQEIKDNWDILDSRTSDKIIVEKVIGIVLDAESGDGRILNTDDPVYNYINYGGLGLEDLDIVMTFLVYNPNTQYTDDVIRRTDFKIGSLNESAQQKDKYIKSFEDLPQWAKPEMREILDLEFINGGTSYKENSEDINMYMSDIKTVIISYRMYKSAR